MQQRGMSGHLSGSEQLRPVIGVFLLVDVDHLDACQWNQTLSRDERLSEVFTQTVMH